ncbi:MAG: MOSC domain-containing protein [Chitinophagaceae bacterium]|nr:MOSC domain-containing protein [Chitinophagaceae bacterium]
MLKISQLFIYPVKSLGGISVAYAQLTGRGLLHDRRWMLVDENNLFLTQREYPQMALLQTAISETGIQIFHKQQPDKKILIPFHPVIKEKITVQVWDDTCEAVTMSSETNEWFSTQLQIPCRLVYMPDDSLRKVDSNYAVHNTDITGFSDGYPLLMIGQASLDELNRRLTEPLPMNRFRPNIVFTGGKPHEEDEMENFITGDINFYGVKLCARCMVTTTNQDTGERGKEPLKTLSAYRMKNNNVYFGQNALYNKPGRLSVGDAISILRRKQGLEPDV